MTEFEYDGTPPLFKNKKEQELLQQHIDLAMWKAVIDDADYICRHYRLLNIKDWRVGGCMSREYAESEMHRLEVRVKELESAILSLVKAKGRYHNEQSLIALAKQVGVTLPETERPEE